MSHRRGNRNNYGRHGRKKESVARAVVENVDENCLVLQHFREYAAELLRKQDRVERIVKLNREITIESKRIIFLLHTIDKEKKQEHVLKEANQRLTALRDVAFKALAYELMNEDPHYYLRVYRDGLEEYVEALTFHQYLQDGKIKDCNFLQNALTYEVEDKSVATTEDTPSTKTICVTVSPYEYILGIGDLTGELMRKCINNLATGHIESCFQTCNFVRKAFIGFVSCRTLFNKQINRKFYTLEQSLSKIENVCYTIKVRGSEIPKHLIIDMVTEDSEHDDEGYQAF